MLNPVNPGCVVPIYRTGLASLRQLHQGFGILASSTDFIAFHFEVPNEAYSRSRFRCLLKNLSGGTSIEIPVRSLRQYQTFEDTTILYFPGGGLNLECGFYEIQLELKGSDGQRWVSEVLQVEDVRCGYQRAGLRIVESQDENGEPLRSIVSDDATTSPLRAGHFEVLVDEQWRPSELPYVLPAEESNIPLGFRRSIRSGCGNDFAVYRYEFGQLTGVDESRPPSSVNWLLTAFGDKNTNRILYGQGFAQQFYFRGPLAGPEFDDQADYLENGQGERWLKYAQTRDLITVTAAGVSDAVLSGLQACKYQSVTLERIGDPTVLRCGGYETSAVPEAGTDLNTVNLTFERAVYVHQHCPPEFRVFVEGSVALPII